MSRDRIALAAVALASLAFASPAAADTRADGLWRIDLTGQGPHLLCHGTIGTTGRILKGRPVYNGRAKYGYKVSRTGLITFWASRRADRASATGQIARDFSSASGTFKIETRPCKGTWKAVRLGA